ncbi:hypothetical protein N657DRAFT_638650 [Parathielavia appendiculata]|uniref:Secreted protein n=1 Tax=Parathielavia appendiculata TaxID=2587402 RepID=A0AAN6Z751_9PEZI|nr:hypothetical protein N657DRAFT_638650 [Parathielavia appendiculata]
MCSLRHSFLFICFPVSLGSSFVRTDSSASGHIRSEDNGARREVQGMPSCVAFDAAQTTLPLVFFRWRWARSSSA